MYRGLSSVPIRRFTLCRPPIKYPCSLPISLENDDGWGILSFCTPSGSNHPAILASPIQEIKWMNREQTDEQKVIKLFILEYLTAVDVIEFTWNYSGFILSHSRRTELKMNCIVNFTLILTEQRMLYVCRTEV